MHTLPLSFALLTYTGYWRPVDWSPMSLKYRAYCVYSVVMILLLNSFAFYGIVDSFIFKDLETYIEKFSLFISVFGVCCKVINLVIHRGRIIGLADMLLKDICLPRNDHETDIQRRFDNNAKWVLWNLIRKIVRFFISSLPSKNFQQRVGQMCSRHLQIKCILLEKLPSTARYWTSRPYSSPRSLRCGVLPAPGAYRCPIGCPTESPPRLFTGLPWCTRPSDWWSARTPVSLTRLSWPVSWFKPALSWTFSVIALAHCRILCRTFGSAAPRRRIWRRENGDLYASSFIIIAIYTSKDIRTI